MSFNDYTFLDNSTEYPEELKPWKEKLTKILHEMNAYGFERLCQRILRECGFSHVEVTKKSGDGGIDGRGKLKINGVFSIVVAFQCKRYKGSVGAPAIRDFRGALTADVEKAVLITTGTFTQEAKKEANNPAKVQIDLINGEELVDMIISLGIGVKPMTSYEIDEDFFENM
ncbi:restriction endonuclease [Acetoanaerobium noterae]|uniref:restriction endonuclease n=1 Tax=Acetoanaerobium noterae TaxID=745369 RepID=UPI00322169C3